MITRRPFGADLSRYSAATKMPSLMFVAPPAWNELICSAILVLSFVSGVRNSASVENVNSATLFGLSAASVVAAASAEVQEPDLSNHLGPARGRHERQFVTAEEPIFLRCIFANLEIPVQAQTRAQPRFTGCESRRLARDRKTKDGQSWASEGKDFEVREDGIAKKIGSSAVTNCLSMSPSCGPK